ncbi:MAG: hypothetical protein BJ554DRAFT_4831, partial [Olpidium bornovanus]
VFAGVRLLQDDFPGARAHRAARFRPLRLGTARAAAMFPKLNSLVGWHDDAVPPEGSVVLVTDTLEPAGEFLLHQFIAAGVRSCSRPAAAAGADSTAARRASPVLLLAMSAPFTHYEAVARKMVGRLVDGAPAYGISLTAAEERGHFAFLDGFTALTTMSRDAAAVAADVLAGVPEQPHHFGPVDAFDEDELACSKRLYDDVERAAAALLVKSGKVGQKGMYLVIDDISAMLSAGAPAGCPVEFFGGNLIVLAHADKGMTLDPEHEYLVKSLMYATDYILAVRPLLSGYSRDVHGQSLPEAGYSHLGGGRRTPPWAGTNFAHCPLPFPVATAQTPIWAEAG